MTYIYLYVFNKFTYFQRLPKEGRDSLIFGDVCEKTFWEYIFDSGVKISDQRHARNTA